MFVPIPLYLQGLIAFCFGACIGSFLNVCAYRIPINRSVVHPGSHCATCGAPISSFNNIPIVSWFLLRGRAACCGTRIDRRYWMVELGTAFLFAGIWLKYGTDPLEALIFCVVVSGLIVSSMIDLDYFIIPDRFTLGGCFLGVVSSALCPMLHHQTTAMQGISWSLVGAMVGGFSLLTVGWLGSLLFKKEAMGMGDVKFIAAMCAFFGGTSILWILPVAAFFGAGLGLVLIFFSNGSWGTRIPFGPFLAMAAVLWLFGGSELTQDYLNRQAEVWQIIFAPWINDSTLYFRR